MTAGLSKLTKTTDISLLTSICKQHAFQHSNTQNIDKLGKRQLGTGLLKTIRLSHDYNNTSRYPIKNQ